MYSEWKNKVIKSFDAKADCYHERSDLQANIVDELINHLPALTNANILEIGCGSGTLTRKLLEKYPDAQFHVTDISPNMIKEAQKNVGKAEHVQWSLMDGEKVSDKRTYDLIVGSMAFQWFEHPEESLSSLRDLLNPTGHLFYTVPSHRSFKEWRSTLSDLSLRHSALPAYEWLGIFNEEEILINYGTTLNFLRNLKGIGANVPNDNYHMLDVSDLKAACATADQKYNGKITWHILYGCVSAPASISKA